MTDLKPFFGILPVMYVIIGYLLIMNDWIWMGILMFCFSVMFGVLFFGLILIKEKKW